MVVLLVGALTTAWLVPVPATAAVTFTVNRTGDATDLKPGNGRCDSSATTGQQCTLRAAIQEANALSGADTIAFDIGTDGRLKTITPGSQLPAITDPVTINGYTQPGASPNTLNTGDDAAIKIQLRGSNAGEAAHGLRLAADDSTVKGLAINRFDGSGIRVTGSRNHIAGNLIGTGADGASDLGNSLGGVDIEEAADNTVGGTSRAARNVISGNGSHGVRIVGTGASGNALQGNYIGTDSTGTLAIGNTFEGVSIVGAPDNLVGGGTGIRNVISGNGGSGVDIFGSEAPNTRIKRNFIGTDATGTVALANDEGIEITFADDATIGGTTSGARNVISGNSGGGVLLETGAGGTVIQGNYVGTDATGTAALGNGSRGITMFGSPGVVVGGTTAGARNVVSANADRGISIVDSPDTVVQGNRVGTKADGTGDLGNGVVGVAVSGSSSNVLVGGTEAAAANVVAHSGTFGVTVLSPATGNTVQRNTIVSSGADGVFISADQTAVGGNAIVSNFGDGVEVAAIGSGNRILPNQLIGNGQLGIDLAGGTQDASGVTANDPDDPDTGANDLQNFPVLSSALRASNGVTTVTGSLNSTPSREFTLQFFLADTEASNHGEAVTFLGNKTVTTDSGGDVGFSFSTAAVVQGQEVTATATNNATGDTSEFSLNVAVVPGP